MSIQYNNTEFQVGVPYPISFRPINSGKVIPNWGELFALDLKTLDFCGKERFLIDYNHDDSQVIGYIDTNTFKVDATGWIGDGFIVSLTEGDKASEVIKLGKAGVPWEVSPTLDLGEATCEFVNDGVKIQLNDQELVGPFTIYRNVPVRGISVCPYGRDNDTSALLGMHRKKLNKKGENMTLTKLSTEDDPKKEGESSTEEETKETVKDETLAKFTARFGAEQGVKLYQQNLDYEAIDAAFSLLKSCGVTTLEDEPKPEDEPEPTKEPTKTEDPPPKKEDEELKKLKAEVAQLRKLARGETSPISVAKLGKEDKPEKVADQIRNRYLARKKE
jgi:hypothetical protein